MKRILLICLCVVAIIAASVLGTLAYLIDSDSALNTFTVGQVDISLDEEKVTPDGQPTPEEDDRVKENTYHLLPGQTYVKDPTVTVKAGSDQSYVRMLVTINCYDALQSICEDKFLPQNFVSGWDGAKWVSTQVVEVSEDGKSATYEFRYFEAVTADAEEDLVLPALFESFTIPGAFDGDDLEALTGLQINVVAHAIQATGFTDALDGEGNVTKTAQEAAWEAFDTQVAPEPGETVPEVTAQTIPEITEG